MARVANERERRGREPFGRRLDEVAAVPGMTHRTARALTHQL